MNGTTTAISVLATLCLLLVLWCALLQRRVSAMERFWKVVGTINDAELLALKAFREAMKKMQARAEEDARLEAKRKLQQQDRAEGREARSEKRGRSSDA